MKTNNTYYFAQPDAIRIFWGYKQEQVTQADFNKDLGETFMPGTPAVLAPMGLNGYLPAVLNLDQPDKYPDEVALIVYPSRPLYDAARANNLLGRIYTFSHKGVFNMTKSRGQWPGTAENPVKHSSFERWAWRVFDRALDWQTGGSRLVVLESSTGTSVYEDLKTALDKDKMAKAGIDEVIVQATKDLATIWFYSEQNQLDFELLNDCGIDTDQFAGQFYLVKDLKSEPHVMRNLDEKLEVTGEKYFQFKFPRVEKYYL